MLIFRRIILLAGGALLVAGCGVTGGASPQSHRIASGSAAPRQLKGRDVSNVQVSGSATAQSSLSSRHGGPSGKAAPLAKTGVASAPGGVASRSVGGSDPTAGSTTTTTTSTTSTTSTTTTSTLPPCPSNPGANTTPGPAPSPPPGAGNHRIHECQATGAVDAGGPPQYPAP